MKQGFSVGKHRHRLHGHRKAPRLAATAAPAAPAAAVQDAFIADLIIVAKAQDTALPTLREAALTQLAGARMPTTRQEAFKYTDLSSLTSQPQAPPAPVDPFAVAAAAAQCTLPAADSSRLIVADGALQHALCSTDNIPSGVHVGLAAECSPDVQQAIGAQASSRGTVFAHLNAVSATGCLVISVDAGVTCSTPLHIVYVSSGVSAQGCATATAPRLLVRAAAGSTLEIVEEFVALDAEQGAYFVNSVAELALEEGATVEHGYIQTEAAGAHHVRSTLVTQARGSSYSLVETRLGGRLSRHDVDVQQGGEQTSTAMRHFLLCSRDQLHDLHTQLTLDHPEGVADQVHKCIVSDASGRGVFDGSVKVNKLAQKSDASQLSRNLLLVPKATVNVKPNLQIIADDVKCTHGCAVSDLSRDEMFYFRSRGIDAATARKALVFSFGAEVVQLHRHKELVARLQGIVNSKLQSSEA